MPPAGHELDAAARIAAADIVGEVVATAPARSLTSRRPATLSAARTSRGQHKIP